MRSILTIRYQFFISIIDLELKAGDDRKKSISGPTNKRQTYSEEKLIALAEAFALSDICTGRSGKIPATEVSTAMRRLGQCPTQLEVNKAIIDVEILRKSKVAAARDEANSKTKKKKKRTGRGKIIINFSYIILTRHKFLWS